MAAWVLRALQTLGEYATHLLKLQTHLRRQLTLRLPLGLKLSLLEEATAEEVSQAPVAVGLLLRPLRLLAHV